MSHLADLATGARYVEIRSALGGLSVVSVKAYAAMTAMELALTRVRAVPRREVIARMARRRAST